MAIPNIKYVNECTKIVYYDAQNNPHDITNVFYADGYPALHPVWTSVVGNSVTTLENIQIVEVSIAGQSSDTSTAYGVDVQTGEPTIKLLPNKDYAVKGDIVVRRNNLILDRILNCYLTADTVGSNNQTYGAWHLYPNNNVGLEGTSYANRTAYHEGTQSNTTAVSFSVFRCDDAIYAGDPACNPYMHYVSSNFVGISGFTFDDTDTTPVILKRQRYTFELHSSDSNPSGLNLISSNFDLQVGSTIDVYPFMRWLIYDVYQDGMSYIDTVYTDSNSASISLQQGFYRITGISSSNSVTAYFDDSNGNHLYELEFQVVPDVTYLVKLNSNIVTGSDVVVGSETLSSQQNIVVYKDTTYPPVFGNDTIYTTSITVQSSDSSIVSCSGTTLSPGNPGTATITVTVDGITLPSFTVTVPQSIPQLYYKVSEPTSQYSSLTYTQSQSSLQNNSSETLNLSNFSSGDTVYFGIKFTTSDNNGRTVYTVNESSIDTANEVEVDILGELNNVTGEEVFQFTMPSGFSSDSIQIPIYIDSNEQFLAGNITINFV